MKKTSTTTTAKTLRLAIVGFGNVGQAVARCLTDATQRIGAELVLVAISDPRFGTVFSPPGEHLDVMAALAAAEAGTFSALAGYKQETDTLSMIEAVDADVLVELSFTDVSTGQPARSHIEAALSRGIHVSTTNKGPIALDLHDLQSLAKQNEVTIGFEGTVMSGTPAIAIALNTARVAGFRQARGILNGTTNYILTRMQEGLDFGTALAEAQDLGYAEADPTGDVDGHDVAAKLVILARVLTDTTVPISAVSATSLRSVTPEMVADAAAAGDRWRYVATLDTNDDEVCATVRPERVTSDDPLWAVSGATNALTFDTEALGSVTVSGPGAGRSETAAAVLSDLAKLVNGFGVMGA